MISVIFLLPNLCTLFPSSCLLIQNMPSFSKVLVIAGLVTIVTSLWMFFDTDRKIEEGPKSDWSKSIGWKILGGVLVAIGIVLKVGNITGFMATFEMAGSIVMAFGAIILVLKASN